MFGGHRTAVEAAGGELIVADGSGLPAPTRDVLGPGTTWVSAPGEGVYQLHARAFPLARGPVVLVTEDHCQVDPDWALTALDLHREYPEASVIGGVVENGAPQRRADWALFFVGHLRDMPSVGRARRVPMAGITNVSYKRAAIEDMRPIGGSGLNQALHQRVLDAKGEVVLIDDRLRVVHVQSPGMRTAFSISWHSARTAAAMRREQITRLSFLRIAAAPVYPFVFTALIAAQTVRRRYHPLAFATSSPLILAMLTQRAIAELVGFFAGPGDSAARFP